MTSIKRPFPPPKSHDRGFLLSADPNANSTEGSDDAIVPLKTPDFLAQVGLLGQLRVISTMILNSYSYTMYHIEFSPAELENIKAAAMEPLKGTLCGHGI